MRSQVRSFKPGAALRATAVCALAFGVSACSSDAMRFSDTPFDSPFKTAQAPAQRDPATTGSIGRTAPVQSAPLASVSAQPLPPPQSAVALRSAAAVPVEGSANGWSAQGGTPIVVAQGETLDVISSRYGVPRSALMSANGLSNPSLAPGSRLIIPVYNAGAASAPRQLARAEAPAEPPRAAPSQSLVPISRPSAPSRPVQAPVADARTKAQAAAEARAQAAAEAKARAAQEQAEAKAKAAADAEAMREARAKFAAEAKAKAEARKAAAASRPAAESKPAAEPKPVVAEARKPPAAPAAQPEKAKPTVVASAPVEPKAAAVPKAPEPAAEPVATASLPKEEAADFRWPARGRVIAGYSGKGANEGINIAVPEGTPVKAAEGGVVAYAGSELKGYGNLVLIRHPNGYVSAYAHNGELNVKRGDTVKRGQVVAKSGQSGNVASPQLHFELRKGSTPVDPIPYLNN